MNKIPKKIYLHIGKVIDNDFNKTFKGDQVALSLNRLLDSDIEYILNKAPDEIQSVIEKKGEEKKCNYSPFISNNICFRGTPDCLSCSYFH